MKVLIFLFSLIFCGAWFFYHAPYSFTIMADESTQNPSFGKQLLQGAAAVIPSAVTSFVGGLFGSHRSKEAQKLSFEQQKQLMEMQNGFNVDMWNRNNEYNSPLHQLKLLSQAGLNPNVYGSNYAPASPQSSEVTAATGSSPGPSNDGAIIANSADKVSNYLSQMALQKRMKQEIRGLTITNDMLQADYDAKSRRYPNKDNRVYVDEYGNPQMDIYPDTNYWDEDRQIHRNANESSEARKQIDYVTYDKLSKELEVYEASMPYFKEMSKWQLRQLKQDVRTKILNNTILNDDVAFRKKFGISPHDEGWSALLKVALTNENAFNNIIDALLRSGERTVTHQYHRIKNLIMP